jgi:hypothetical protein
MIDDNDCRPPPHASWCLSVSQIFHDGHVIDSIRFSLYAQRGIWNCEIIGYESINELGNDDTETFSQYNCTNTPVQSTQGHMFNVDLAYTKWQRDTISAMQ